jgi:hypothetical protein
MSTRLSSLNCPAGEFVVKSISKETNMASKAAMISGTDPKDLLPQLRKERAYCTPHASRK